MSTDGIPAGWTPRRPSRSPGCPVCGAKTEIVISVSARMAAKAEANGPPKVLQSASVTLCNDHALALFAECSATVEAARDGKGVES